MWGWELCKRMNTRRQESLVAILEAAYYKVICSNEMLSSKERMRSKLVGVELSMG